MKSGIYTIKNIINNKSYIGISNNVQARLKRHLRELRQNKHINEKLQNGFNKYGEENFRFEILQHLSVELLEEKEKVLIKQYNSVENGYNIEYGGNYNKTINISTKTKQSTQRIGDKNSNAIISDKVAIAILNDLKNLDNTLEFLSYKYNVSMNVISNLQLNRSYKHLLPNIRAEIKNRQKLIGELRLKNALESVLNGMSQNTASNIYNVSRNTLRRELKKIS